MPLAPEPSRLRRVTTAVRRWASRSVWRALGLVVALGTVAGLALGFGITGPFWAQIAGWIVMLTLGVAVVSWIDAQSWQRAVVAVLFFAPMFALVAVIGPMNDAAFAHENGYALARRTARLLTRTGGCTGVYAYDVDGTTYHSIMSWGRCPSRLMVEYVVAEPWHARPQPNSVGPPPPPAPPPGADR
ncbi:MAG TPA: hypothetical protein VGB53_08880 [Rubricoccaceae bacterium]|jgi:hypothetical protein